MKLLWVLPIAVCLAADVHQEVLDVFTDLAASLSANDAERFLGAFDPKMSGYARLRDEITGLTREGEIQSSVEVTKDEGDAQHRTVEVDWRLRVRRAADATASTPREQHMVFQLEKRGKKWKVVEVAQPSGAAMPRFFGAFVMDVGKMPRRIGP
jgi:hypothetical protein